MGVWNDRYCIIEDRGFWRDACLGADGIILVCSYEIVTIEDEQIAWIDHYSIGLGCRTNLL